VHPGHGVGRRTIGRAFVQVCRYCVGLRDTGHSKCTPERAASHRLSEACGIEVQVCAPAGTPAGRIGDDVDSIGDLDITGRIGAALGAARDGDDPQQLGGWRALPATHAGAHRIRTTYHRKVYPSDCAVAPSA
jgi:hypothetical protein